MIGSVHTDFWLQLSLDGMRPEDCLRVRLPEARLRLRVGKLLEWVFPPHPQGQARVEEMLDRRSNPDLPDIYAVFLDVFDQWRLGHCSLHLSTAGGQEVGPEDRVNDRLTNASSLSDGGVPTATLELHIVQKYLALQHAATRGCWESLEGLLDWLRSLSVLYFLDKHGSPLSDATVQEIGEPLAAVARLLLGDGIIESSPESGNFAITPEGRRLIGDLLAETEAYIDQYDLFKDVVYDELAGTVEFGTGRGLDLRAQVFLAEGLDPVRVVFLLRLYDGALDEFACSWQRRVCDPEFFNQILEPVVNYDQVDESAIVRVIESGLAEVEERQEAERVREWQRAVRASLDPDAGLPR